MISRINGIDITYTKIDNLTKNDILEIEKQWIELKLGENHKNPKFILTPKRKRYIIFQAKKFEEERYKNHERWLQSPAGIQQEKNKQLYLQK